MTNNIRDLSIIIAVVFWVIGIAVASSKGALMTAAALLPPIAWIIAARHFLGV